MKTWQLQDAKANLSKLVSFLRQSPLVDLDIEFERDKSDMRDIEL